MHRVWLVAGAVSAFIALAFAAYTSHALGDNYLPMMRMMLDTAREIQFVHALALIAVGILTCKSRTRFSISPAARSLSALFSFAAASTPRPIRPASSTC